jgi:hypothetical protein
MGQRYAQISAHSSQEVICCFSFVPQGACTQIRARCGLLTAICPNAVRRTIRYVGNLEPMPGVFPDYPAPATRNAGDAEETVLMR